MTKEQFISALTKIQSTDNNIDALISGNLLPEEILRKPNLEIARASAMELYSDELLEELNKRFKPVTACNMTWFDVSVSGCLMDLALDVRDRVTPDLVWGKPAAYVGYNSVGFAAVLDAAMYDQYVATYIDTDGEVFCVNCDNYALLLTENIEDAPVMSVQKLAGNLDLVSLSDISNFLPGKYDGFWDI